MKGNISIVARPTIPWTDIDDGGGAAVNVEKAQQELDLQDGGLDDVLSHNFFANLYYDYRSDSKFTPYVGVWRRVFASVAGLLQSVEDGMLILNISQHSTTWLA